MKTSPFRAVFNRPSTAMEKYLLAIIIGYIVIVALKNPLFFSVETLFDMLRSGSGVMILAIGVLIVLVSGGIDVSFTAIAVVSGYTSVKLMLALGIDNILFAFVVSIVVGCLLGAINALIIYRFALPTLIVTLGTASAYHGLMATVLGTKSFPTGAMPQSLVNFGSTDLIVINSDTGRYGLTIFLPIVIAVLVLTWFILYRTMLGRQVFAVGSNEESASRLGINIFRTKLFVYSYSGALSGLMGIIYFSELKYVNPVSLVGTELMIIAAVVIGGAKLTGGEGTILGTILGIVVVQLFQSTLVFLGLGSSWNDLFFGAVLLISLGVMYYRQRIQDRKNLVFATA